MAKLSPFKAIRPSRDKVHLVATRPYYTYKSNVLEAKLQDNPFTFLHIINPEFGKAVSTEPNSQERFEMIGEAYQDFIDQGILIQDEQPHLYLYRQTKNGHEYIGVIAGASIEEYDKGAIKKHESTITSRENMFTNYLDIVGYNAEPVLLSYQDDENVIDELLNWKTFERPEYEYATTDLIKHELWLFSEKETEAVINAFEHIDACYIADGHHRSASSSALKNLRNNQNQDKLVNEKSFLAFFLNEKRLHITEFNRFVKTLNEHSAKEVLSLLSVSFTVTKLTQRQNPTREHNITICIQGEWFLLEFKDELLNSHHPVQSLDAEILTQYVLKPILGINNLKTDEHIEFISGINSLEKMEKEISNGKYQIGFFLFPIKIDQIKQVADMDMTMPPKSTWIEPKLRSGLTIYNIDE
ncbi:DUF1015 domain-containing protein [Crocinitomicaceae bacterium]|nr:DUF1015 domain-containing protein [Crocinitomicaceae bacterium]